MGDFYVRLLSGDGRAEALRDAQRAMKRRPGREDPSVWAAFICQGEPGPLRLGGQDTG
jgi:CHAT domain-containing protein